MSEGDGHPVRESEERARRLHRVVALIFLVGMIGCANSQIGSTTTSSMESRSVPIQTADPCANRLQDISGLLLMYSLSHSDLPASLDELRSEPGFEDVKEFVCPVSHQKYVYMPDGLPYEGGFLVVYDATPAHSGMRWAVQLTRPTGNQPLQTKVIAVKESFFAKLKK